MNLHKKNINYIKFFSLIIVLAYNCNSNQNMVDKKLFSTDYLVFKERTNDMFGKYSYPIYYPYDNSDCNGFRLFFSRTTNITDTLTGIIEIEDSNGLSINYQVYNSPKENSNQLYLLPMIDSIEGVYSYAFILEDERIADNIKFTTSNQDTIILYKDGDKKGSPVQNACYKLR